MKKYFRKNNGYLFLIFSLLTLCACSFPKTRPATGLASAVDVAELSDSTVVFHYILLNTSDDPQVQFVRSFDAHALKAAGLFAHPENVEVTYIDKNYLNWIDSALAEGFGKDIALNRVRKEEFVNTTSFIQRHRLNEGRGPLLSSQASRKDAVFLTGHGWRPGSKPVRETLGQPVFLGQEEADLPIGNNFASAGKGLSLSPIELAEAMFGSKSEAEQCRFLKSRNLPIFVGQISCFGGGIQHFTELAIRCTTSLNDNEAPLTEKICAHSAANPFRTAGGADPEEFKVYGTSGLFVRAHELHSNLFEAAYSAIPEAFSYDSFASTDWIIHRWSQSEEGQRLIRGSLGNEQLESEKIRNFYLDADPKYGLNTIVVAGPVLNRLMNEAHLKTISDKSAVQRTITRYNAFKKKEKILRQEITRLEKELLKLFPRKIPLGEKDLGTTQLVITKLRNEGQALKEFGNRLKRRTLVDLLFFSHATDAPIGKRYVRLYEGAKRCLTSFP